MKVGRYTSFVCGVVYLIDCGLGYDESYDLFGFRITNDDCQSRNAEDDNVNQYNKRNAASDDSDEASTAIRTSRRIEMPPEFLFPENAAPPADLVSGSGSQSPGEDQTDRSAVTEDSDISSDTNTGKRE